MREFEIELSVGDALQLGDYVLTILDVERGEISFRLDRSDSVDAHDPIEAAEARTWLPR